MKSLLLHNNGLSPEFIASFSNKEVFYPSRAEQFDSSYDLDKFIHNRLRDILSGQSFDCIFISLSLNNDDYLQLTGLLVALHIRLTPKLAHHNISIVLVGSESHFEISKLSSLDDLIYTPGIFILGEQTKQGRAKMEELIKAKNGVLTEEETKMFLERIIITPPSKYASHHSLANEWGIKRMCELFSDNLPQALKDELNNIDQGLGTSIYFKFLEEKAKRKRVRSGDKIPATLPGVKGKKVVYIDDEHGKGWGVLLEFLFEKEGASLKQFHGFKKGLDRDALLGKIKAYLDGPEPEINNADIYIVDLRLCDQDFDRNTGDPTGLLVLDHLIAKNKGNQVVIFTASNKIWNLKDAYKRKACGYSIKESPEMNHTIAQTQKLFSDLQSSIRLASEKSYLKDFWILMERIKDSPVIKAMTDKGFSRRLTGNGGWLDQIFTLLMMHDKTTYNQVLVIFLSILELYSDVVLRYDAVDKKAYVICADDKEAFVFENESKGFFSFETNGFSYQITPGNDISGVTLYQQITTTPSVRHTDGNRVKLLAKIIPVLQTRNGLNKQDIDKVVEFKYLRDNLAAHGKNNVKSAERWINRDDIEYMIKLLKKIFL